MKTALYSILLACLILFLPTKVQSQEIERVVSSAPTGRLVFTKVDNSNKKYIMAGRNISVLLKGDNVARVNGNFSIVDAETLLVGETEVAVQDIVQVRLPRLVAVVIGAILAAPSSFFMGLGLVLLGSGLINNDELVTIIGAGMSIVMVIPTAISYGLLFSGKTYNLGWQYKMTVEP